MGIGATTFAHYLTATVMAQLGYAPYFCTTSAVRRSQCTVDDAFYALIGRAAYETARRLYENERVDFRDGARIIARSEPAVPGLKAKT